MSKRVPNAHELATQILKNLRDGSLLAAGDLAQVKLNEQVTLERIAGLLVDAGFPDREVETKHVTVLLSDIRGFSSIAESYPARDVVELLNRYFARMGDIIFDYGGTIDKLMGDSILVVFGLPKARPDDVERAIACAVEMQIAMADVNAYNQSIGMPDLFMGIGINSGNVVVGDLGSDHYNEYTVIGDEVNLVSRIESHCLRGQILISQNTYAIAKDFVQVGPPNEIEVKGAGRALRLYEVYSTERPAPKMVPRREGRKSPRVPAVMPMTFQCLSGKIVQPERYRGQVLDVSYHGMAIESELRLGRLSEVKMTLALELFGERTSDIYARVLKSDAYGNLYRTSLEFTSINPEAQAAIKQFVDQRVVAL